MAITRYVAERRGVICTPEQIVVGAGVQSLLHILCTLTGVTVTSFFYRRRIYTRESNFSR